MSNRFGRRCYPRQFNGFTLVELPAASERAFTLVELLVVIGIIALLISVLMPALSAARRQANLVKCASNLRQIATGCLLRAQDSKGYFPLAGEIVLPMNASSGTYAQGLNDSNRTRYTYATAPGATGDIPVPLPGAIAPYLGYQKNLSYNNWDKLDKELDDRNGVWRIFTCPATDSYDKHMRATSSGTSPEGQGTMMAIKILHFYDKAILAWSTNTDYAINEGVFGFNCEPAFKHTRLAGHVGEVHNPSRTMLFTDAVPAAGGAYNFMPDPWITWKPWPQIGQSITMSELFAPANSRKAQEDTMFDKRRHKGRMNVVFADGHVETKMINAQDLNDVYFLYVR
jgi:prepilin-type processing-associated H-X9-DG protein/prepilin-type N-terminal cleavage/methylation domain-containing protein